MCVFWQKVTWLYMAKIGLIWIITYSQGKQTINHIQTYNMYIFWGILYFYILCTYNLAKFNCNVAVFLVLEKSTKVFRKVFVLKT